MAKKQVCITVLIRVPIPLASRDRVGVDHVEPQPPPTISSCTSHGSSSQTSSGPYGAFSRNVPPGSAYESTSYRSRNDH